MEDLAVLSVFWESNGISSVPTFCRNAPQMMFLLQESGEQKLCSLLKRY